MSGTENTNAESGTQSKEENQDSTQSKGAGRKEKEAGDGNEGGEDSSDLFSDPKRAEKEIKKLRAENAKHRTKNTDLEGRITGMQGTLDKLKAAIGGESKDDLSPEEMVEKLKGQNETVALEASVTQLAWERGIAPEHGKYFKFLMGQKLSELKDDEELSDEDIEEIVAEVKKLEAKKPLGSTGLNLGGKQPNAKQEGDSLTVESFAKMSPSQKSLLYTQKPDVYNRLFGEAKEKRLL